MADHKEFEETDAMKTQPRPTLRTPKPTLGSKDAWRPPPIPGARRKVHKPHGKRVKVHVHEEY